MSHTSAGNTLLLLRGKASGKFLKVVYYHFFSQLVSKPAMEGALLDLTFVSQEGLVGDAR